MSLRLVEIERLWIILNIGNSGLLHIDDIWIAYRWYLNCISMISELRLTMMMTCACWYCICTELRKAVNTFVLIYYHNMPFIGQTIAGFLFSKISETPIVLVPKLFPLLHWSQNTFCFLSSSTPSHVGKFFWLQWEFQWENDQNKKNGQKSLFRGPKWFPKCLNGGFRGGICIEKWS